MVATLAVDDVIATTIVIVVVIAAIAAAPNEVNDDAAGYAIATTIASRVAPSSKPHKNSATL